MGLATHSNNLYFHNNSWSITSDANYKRLGLALGSEQELHYIYRLNPSVQSYLLINWTAQGFGGSMQLDQQRGWGKGSVVCELYWPSGSFYSNHSKRYPCRNSWRISRNLQGKLPILTHKWPTKMHKFTIFIIQSNDTMLLLCRWSTALLLRNSVGCVENV